MYFLINVTLKTKLRIMHIPLDLRPNNVKKYPIMVKLN